MPEQNHSAPLPREKLALLGSEQLLDHELLAIILGSGIKGKNVHALAKDVMRYLDKNDYFLSVDTLQSIAGLGFAKASLLCATLEFARRIIIPRHCKITQPADLLPFVHHYSDRKQECFLAINLNGANEIITKHVVTVGLVNQTLVHPREVFAESLKDRAAAVIVAHNHPSGTVTPSKEDREVTMRLKSAGAILGIELLDHIIFSKDQYFSFREQGLLKQPATGSEA